MHSLTYAGPACIKFASHCVHEILTNNMQQLPIQCSKKPSWVRTSHDGASTHVLSAKLLAEGGRLNGQRMEWPQLVHVLTCFYSCALPESVCKSAGLGCLAVQNLQ